jgi:hypothetical protein
VKSPTLRIAPLFLFVTSLAAQPFQLPTANRHLFTPGAEEKFFVGTTGKPWTSGMFGCVRGGGAQLHEGIDIKCLQRDKRGEPTDPVLATADGTVAYFNTKQSLSNYGKYLILRHRIEGLEIYSLYAHLREIRADLKPGAAVKSGETVATMGRTTNTREGISRDRAHVHFELNLLLSDHFADWYKKHFPNERNDHGVWNGHNLAGLDPCLIFLAEAKEGKDFNLARFVRNETPLCRVLVRDASLPFASRYPALVQRNPAAEKEGVAGYEVSIDYAGAPVRLVPRAASEIKSKARFQLLAVNDAEAAQHPCRKLVTKRRGRWDLANNGISLLELLAE